MTVALLCLSVLLADSLQARWEALIEAPCLNHVVARQELLWPLTGDSIARTVEFWFVPPNRFRACYGQPDSQEVVADGATIRTYVPENRQVLVQTQDVAMSWRDSPLGEFLRLEPASTRADTVMGGQRGKMRTWLDETGARQYVRVEAFVPEGETWPLWVRLEDIGGNTTTYTVREWERAPIPPRVADLFTLTVPAGVDAILVD